MTFSKLTSAVIAGVGWLAITAGAKAAMFDVSIQGTDAIFLAGRTDLPIPPANVAWGDGSTATFDGMARHVLPTPEEALETLPPTIPVLPGQVVRVLNPAIGGINFFNGFGPPFFGPEGNAGPSDLAEFAGISGYKANQQGALTGVFLGPGIPNAGPAPATLDFTAGGLGIDFNSLSPLLGQVFFIGDGQNSLNVFQQFVAPAGATRLALGIPDGFAFIGVPGFYDDNDGTYRIIVGIDEIPRQIPEVPIPAALPLFAAGLGLLSLVGLRRRARKA